MKEKFHLPLTHEEFAIIKDALSCYERKFSDISTQLGAANEKKEHDCIFERYTLVNNLKNELIKRFADAI